MFLWIKCHNNNLFFKEKTIFYEKTGKIIEAIITSIQEDDIYKYLAAYPEPEHRSFALAR